jgi:paraquat-inducible protein B
VASPRGNPAVIGGFVVGAVALAALAVIVFGSGRMFETRTRMVTYFEGAVTGLDVGAPVIFQGVQIGQVRAIDAMVDATSFDVIVRVYFDVVGDQVETIGEAELMDERVVLKFIEKGLRAQLKSQSYITGKLYLDLALHPEAPLVLHELDPSVPEIPSIPTTLEEVGRQVGEFLVQLKELRLDEMVSDLASTIRGLDQLINKPELAEAIDRLNDTMGEARSVLARVDRRTDGLVDGMEDTVRELKTAATAAEQALSAIQSMVEPGSAVHRELLAALVELKATLQSVRTLSDGLSQQPEQLIFGRSNKEGN